MFVARYNAKKERHFPCYKEMTLLAFGYLNYLLASATSLGYIRLSLDLNTSSSLSVAFGYTIESKYVFRYPFVSPIISANNLKSSLFITILSVLIIGLARNFHDFLLFKLELMFYNVSILK